MPSSLVHLSARSSCCKLTGIQTAPRQLLDRPARRAAILKAAAVAFAEKGYAATSMADVAAASGVTKLIVYRHFDSKETLYDAVLEGVAERARDRFLEGIGANPDQPGSGAVRALLAVAREDEAAFILLWRHAVREPQFAEHAESIRLRGVRVAEKLLEPLRLRPPAVRRWAASTIVSYLIGAILNWLDTGDASRDDVIADLLARSLPAVVGAWAAPADHVPSRSGGNRADTVGPIASRTFGGEAD